MASISGELTRIQAGVLLLPLLIGLILGLCHNNHLGPQRLLLGRQGAISQPLAGLL